MEYNLKPWPLVIREGTPDFVAKRELNWEGEMLPVGAPIKCADLKVLFNLYMANRIGVVPSLVPVKAKRKR